MIKLTFYNFIVYIVITWGTNILFNLLYVIKKYKPAYVAKDKAIDGNIMFYGNRLIGESTTLFGFIIAILASLLVYTIFTSISLAVIPLLVYLGHTLGSFIKRRFGLEDGKFMPFIDHGDYMITTGIILTSLGYISFKLALAGLAFTYVFHPIACFIAFKLKLRQYPY